MSTSLTHEAFTAQLNTKFTIPLDEANRVELTLIEVSELQLSPRQEQFSIVFRGPLDMFLGQGMRPFDHDQMDRFELFLVPIKKDDEGFHYEAVFNRLRKTS
ncbi:MAG: hypothetical protein JWM21_1793 [Acidobacteria bacterium]|nr:hypothetical protein [Acidobacteriota bacterium]